MPEFSSEQLQSLGQKLDRMAGDLTEEERALLMTTFGLAAKATGNVEEVSEAREEGEESGTHFAEFRGGRLRIARDLPRLIRAEEVTLSDGLISAFEPGEVGRFVTDVNESVEVGGTVKWSK